MKKYIFLAASALTLASCTSDDFLGDTPGSTPTSAKSAINFGGDAGKITRATSNEGTPQQMLDGQFLVYGVKKTNDEIFHNVFVNYSVWDVTDKTTSNTKGWEYVGEQNATNLGTGQISLKKAQTIKYWDYSASVYHFVAGSPINAFTYQTPMDITTGTDIKISDSNWSRWSYRSQRGRSSSQDRSCICSSSSKDCKVRLPKTSNLYFPASAVNGSCRSL